MSYYDEEMKKRADLKKYLEMKYGKSYMSAIAKLNEPDQFDEKGFLKPELVLTPQEKEAMLLYVPETSEILNQSDTMKML